MSWRNVFAGREWTCATTAAGDAYCWGNNDDGQLGDGTTDDTQAPSLVADGANDSGGWLSMDLGYDFTCGVGSNHKAYCWGGNFYGQLGNGTRQTSDDSLPLLADTPAGQSVRSIGTGVDSEFTCATTDESVLCWGSDHAGALGNPAALSPQTTPLAIAPTWQSPGTAPRSIAVGGMSSMLLVGAVAPPAPVPSVPSSPPSNAVAMAGDASAVVSWAAPMSSGSFPVTNYLVTSSPGGRTCLTSGLSCTVAGLSNGTAYTFTVQALTGAGWSPSSDPSNSVTPAAVPRPTITITGAREGKRIEVSGISSGFGMGAILHPWVRLAGQSTYTQGSASVLVSVDGTFVWSRKTGKRAHVYMQTPDGSVRSNTVMITAR